MVHSWAGALGARIALDYPERVAGLVMLAPVAYPWPGGVGRYNKIVAMPVIGPLLAYTITLPLGTLLVEPGARGVFLPQTMPDGLCQRHRDDAAAAAARISRQCARSGDAEGGGRRAGAALRRDQGAGHDHLGRQSDKTVSTNIHSRPLAATAPNAKLIVLPGVGHMVQNAAPDLVIAEIEAMIGAMAKSTAAAN